MATIITSRNYNKEVLNIIKNIIPGCKNIYIRVGYFYFSGFSLIAKSLADKNIKILVGMEADKTTNDYLKKFLETVDQDEILDKPEERDAYFIFKNKLKDGSLEIKQNKTSDHSKVFIFEYTNKNAKIFNGPGQTMVGSANATHSGFITNKETNVLLPSPDNFKSLSLDFNDDWESSIPLLNKKNFKDFEKYSSKFPFEQTPSPYLMFVRVLNEYFKDRSNDIIKLPKEITENYYGNFKYQRDAISKGLDILDKHNGVIIADVVGLGKSVVASAIANNLGLRVIVICPPHLKEQWDDYLYKFDVKNKIYTSGKISEAIQEDTPGQKVIIIDEVHKFRNDETKDYLNLYQLCHGAKGKEQNKIILLSATPFNNEPSDTFSLIKLFQIPTRSTLQTSTNLSVIFEQINKKFKKLRNNKKKGNTKVDKENVEKLGEEIRNIIEPLIIRRSRIDLKNIKAYDTDLKKQKIFFPEVQDPVLLEYELGSLEKIYKKTLEIISPGNDKSGYKCARYKPLTYVKPEFINEVLEKGDYKDQEKKNKLPTQQENIHDFIKRMMVRRFESSTHSFSITLDRVIKSNKRIIKFFEEKKVIPIYPRHQLPDLEELFQMSTDDNIHIDDLDIEEDSKLEKAKSKGLYFIEKKQLKENYIVDVKNDLEILIGIQDDWKFLNEKEFKDPKTEAIKKFINNELKNDPKRKIIIFTEFSDTANYLYAQIKKVFKRVNVYTSKESSSKKKKTEIAENFDAGIKNQKNDYDILIATDTISEGFNLHRAGTVINYDIPYNPTRVVQRFGRINRMNKKMFDKLYIYNFFPTEIGETEVNLKRITGIKKLLFNSIFGEDTKVLSQDETLTSYFQKSFNDIYKMLESETPETYYENLIYDLREYHPEIIMDANNISRRAKVKRKIKTKENGLLIFSKKGEIPRFIFSGKSKEINNLLPTEAFKLFDAKLNEKHLSFDKKYDLLYEEIKTQIFADRKILPPNKKKKDLINKLELLSKESRYKDYYTNMYKVVKELDALTPFQLKTIKKISQSSDQDIKNTLKVIPEQLLKNLLKRYNEIELKKDAVIITEQIND